MAPSLVPLDLSLLKNIIFFISILLLISLKISFFKNLILIKNLFKFLNLFIPTLLILLLIKNFLILSINISSALSAVNSLFITCSKIHSLQIPSSIILIPSQLLVVLSSALLLINHLLLISSVLIILMLYNVLKMVSYYGRLMLYIKKLLLLIGHLNILSVMNCVYMLKVLIFLVLSTYLILMSFNKNYFKNISFYYKNPVSITIHNSLISLLKNNYILI